LVLETIVSGANQLVD